MNSVHISHNPFTVDTAFVINGSIPDKVVKISSYKEQRLQRWVDYIFNDLFELFIGSR